MNFEYIKSKDNRTLKTIMKLQSSSSFRKKNDRFVLEGLRLCRDAVMNGYKPEILAVTENTYNQFKSDIDYMAENSERVVLLEAETFLKLSDTKSPQGVLSVLSIPQNTGSVQNIKNGKYIILENLQDPSNLGAVARTAEALGIDGLIIDNKGCDPYSPKAQRAGMGALLRLPIYISSDFYSDLSLLKEKGFSLFATVPDKTAVNVKNVVFGENSAAIIGNEGNGLTENAVCLCDNRVTIPMIGRAESLNASVAASIIMWEMVK